MSKLYRELADLYDRAFSWDVSGEVDWLLERLGGGGGAAAALLEPGCGSGRLFPDFARRGVAVTGVDASAAMLGRARARMAALGLPEPRLVEADMADFDLGTTFDGALCPINTFTHLTTLDQAAAHLRAVARHLRPGGRYLVQLDLEDLSARTAVPPPPDSHSAWEVEADGSRLRCQVFGESWDAERRLETQVTRFTLLAGPGAGEVHEDRNRMRLWDWRSWQTLVAGSPFTQAGAYDGSRAHSWPPVAPGPSLEGMRLTWHELVRD